MLETRTEAGVPIGARIVDWWLAIVEALETMFARPGGTAR